jgi:hypothetical protein
MPANGPSRHFVCAQQSGRFQVKADIKWQVGPAASVANDPERKFGLVTKFDILIRAKRNGLERPSERALQSLTGVRVEPAPVAENDAFWLP